MTETRVTLRNPSGLHARPAHRFAQAAGGYRARVLVRKDGGEEEVEAASVLSLLTLDCRQGDTIVIRAEGEGAEEAVQALAALVEEGLGEGPEA